jgi:hypothetical protein
MTHDETVKNVTKQLLDFGIEAAVPTDLLKTRVALAAYQWGLQGNETILEVRLAPPPPPQKSCATVYDLADLSSNGRTGADGSVTLHIRDFFCADDVIINGEDGVWVTAIPQSSTPVYLTHLILRPTQPPHPLPPPDPNDIQVRFFAWDSAGKPKSEVLFTWRVLLRAGQPIG